MSAQKVVTGTCLFALTILATATTSVSDAAADPPKVAVAPAPVARRVAFKTSTKPAMALSSELKIKVKAAIDKALADFAKDKDITKLMTAGAALGPDGDSFFRSAMAGVVSATQHSKYYAAGTAPKVTAVTGYSIEAGEVISATTGPSCGGEVQFSFTIKNRGPKLPAGVTARLFSSLGRASAPSTVISSAWLNLPALDAGATTTVQVPALRHNASSGGNCLSGDIIVTPTFTEAKGYADYRLRIQLTDSGPEATLLSGPFLATPDPNGGGSSTGGSDDCTVGQKCASGACALLCPPCSGPFKETSDGTCAFVPGGNGGSTF